MCSSDLVAINSYTPVSRDRVVAELAASRTVPGSYEHATNYANDDTQSFAYVPQPVTYPVNVASR